MRTPGWLPRLVALAAPAICVALVYVVAAGSTITSPDAVDAARVGQAFLDKGRGSSAAIDRLDAHLDIGYDGQFSVFIALDPLEARHYMDSPIYRSSRPLLPLVARAISLGDEGRIPGALILVNVVAAVVLTLMLSLFLVRRGASPWYALIVGLSPGLFRSVSLDLTEPLAAALVAASAVVIDRGRIVAGSGVLGLAALSRETSLVYAILALRERRHVRRLVLALLLAAVPYLALRVGLKIWIGGEAAPKAVFPDLVPFRGFVKGSGIEDGHVGVLLAVLLPLLIGWAWIVAATRRATPLVVALSVNVLLLVALLPESSWNRFTHAGRITLAVLVGIVLCLPALRPRQRLLAGLLLAGLCAVGWWLP